MLIKNLVNVSACSLRAVYKKTISTDQTCKITVFENKTDHGMYYGISIIKSKLTCDMEAVPQTMS